MKLMGVGNEQWGTQYVERYKILEKAIHAKYPQIRLVASVGPNPNGDIFDEMNPAMRKLNANIIDEHYYSAPEWFLQNARRYDNYDRKGPKIFAGEYAAQSVATVSPDNKNNWNCALSEAAYMTGLERNADVVYMASYAPLFAHAEGWQWTPDLIWFDNLHAYGTPDYYVQKLFSLNKGTTVVPMLLNNEALSGQDGCYATASLDEKTRELIIKFVNAGDGVQHVNFVINGISPASSKVNVTTLMSSDLTKVNSFDNPMAISPVPSTANLEANNLKMKMEPRSLKVVRVKY